MSILANLLGVEIRSNIETIMKKALESFYGTSTGIHVSPGTSIRNTAVFDCVRILAETVASLPLIIYERQVPRGKKRAQDHYLYSILHDKPNEKMTAFEYRETLQGHLALWGNAYSQIDYDARGRVRALWPLRPDKMLDIVEENGRRFYHYQLPSNKLEWLPEERVWHLRGLGGDGLNGYSPITLMRKAIGLGMAAEEYGSRFFGSGARPGGVLEHPGKLSDDAHTRMSKSWNESHRGLENAQTVAILEEGVKYTQVGVPPDDAQFLETRKFQVTEIARIFRMPPHMIGDLERATFSNIEHQAIEFVVHTIRPWLVRWESSISQFLMLADERQRYFAEFLVEGLLRGDTASRFEAYATGKQWGWLSTNDIREFENMNPIEGGDVYLVPMNMIPARGGEADPAQLLRVAPALLEGEIINGTIEETRAETIQQRSLNARRRIMDSQLPLLEEVAARVYRREINDVGAQARKLLKRGNPEFDAWLREFYQGHREWSENQVRAVFLAYAELMAGEAAAEVGAEIESQAIENFVNKYVASYAERQAAYSEEHIRAIVEGDYLEEDLFQALKDEFTLWRTDRPAKTAFGEMVQQGNAVSKFAYGLGGSVAIRWHKYGKSCPYCSNLNGQVVGMKQYYIGAGENYQPEGADKPLVTSVNVGHPPAHGGCDCMISAA